MIMRSLHWFVLLLIQTSQFKATPTISMYTSHVPISMYTSHVKWIHLLSIYYLLTITSVAIICTKSLTSTSTHNTEHYVLSASLLTFTLLYLTYIYLSEYSSMH